MQSAGRSYARVAGPEEPFRSLAPDPLERTSFDAFVAAARRALMPKAATEVRTDHVAPVRASVRDAIETVLALLPDTGEIRFRDLVARVDEKLEVIVRFLAVLELFKQGIVDLDQSENFAELIVRPLAPGERASLDFASIEDWEDEPRAFSAPATADRVARARAEAAADEGDDVDLEPSPVIETVGDRA
jgi:segregation and condensation protein A